MSDQQRVVVQLTRGHGPDEEAHFVTTDQLSDAYCIDDVTYGEGVSSSHTHGAAVILSAAAQMGSGVDDDIDVTGGDAMETGDMMEAQEAIRVVQAPSVPLDVHRSGPTYIVRSVPAHKALAMGMKMAPPSSTSNTLTKPFSDDHSYMSAPQDHEYGTGPSHNHSAYGSAQYKRMVHETPRLVHEYSKYASAIKEEELANEEFPIIGDLQAYTDDPEAGIEAISTNPPARRQQYYRTDGRTTGGDGVAITSYKPGNIARVVGAPNNSSTPIVYRGVNKSELSPIVYQPEFKVHGNTKYFRPTQGGQLIRIGSRTFIAMQEEEEPAYYPLDPNGHSLNKPIPYATRSQLPPTAVPALRGGRHNTSRVRRALGVGGGTSGTTTLREVPNLPADLQAPPPNSAPLIISRSGPTAPRPPIIRGRGMRLRGGHVVTNHQSENNHVTVVTRNQTEDEKLMEALQREENAMNEDEGGHFLEDVEKKYNQLLSRPLAGDKTQAEKEDVPDEMNRPELSGNAPNQEPSEYGGRVDTYEDSIDSVIQRAMSGALGAEIDAALHAAHAAASELMRQRAMERARDANPFRTGAPMRGRQAPIPADFYRSRVDTIFDGIYDSSKFEKRFAERLKMDDETSLAARQLESELNYPASPPHQYQQQIITPQRYGSSAHQSYSNPQRVNESYVHPHRSIVNVPAPHVVAPQYPPFRSPPPPSLKSNRLLSNMSIASPTPMKIPNTHIDHVLSDIELTSESDESDNDDSTESSDTDTEGEWAGVDYITRCICGLQHNDEFMIECDQCGVWQHCRCMGIDTKRVPENYLCERCKPRNLKLNAEQAREMQTKKLGKWNREKDRRRQVKMKKREAKLKIRQKKREDKLKKRRMTEELPIGKVKMSDKYQFIMENEYTEDAKRFLQSQSDTRGANLLEVPAETICQVMFVAESVQGLVSSMTVPPNQPVAEYRGRVCTKAECNGRDKLGRVLPYTLLYSGFTPTESMLGSRHSGYVSDGTLVVDARLKGSPARFARRSCRPNTQIKHVIKQGKVHMLLISTELIEETSEVTIPFDFDYRTARQSLDCACVAAPPQLDYNDAQDANEHEPEPHICPIREFNEQLKEHSFMQKHVRSLEKDRDSERAAMRAAAKAQHLLRKKLNKKISKESKRAMKNERPVRSERPMKRERPPAKIERPMKSERPVKRGPTAVQAKIKAPVKKAMKTVSSVALKKAKEHSAKLASKKKSQQLKVKLSSSKPSPGRGRPPKNAGKKPSPRKEDVPRERRRSRAESVGSEGSMDITTKRENQMLKELRDYWNKDPGNEEDNIVILPEEAHSRTSREERKIQMMLEQFKKLEESERKKDDRRLSEEQPLQVTRKGARVGPKTKVVEKKGGKKKRSGKWKKGIEKKSTPKKGAKKNQKASPRRTPRHKQESEVVEVEEEAESDEEDEESEDVSQSEEEEEAQVEIADKAAATGSVARPPPRKRWGSNAQSNTPGSPMGSPPYSTRSSAGSPLISHTIDQPLSNAKKRWLRQAIEEQRGDGEGVATRRNASPTSPAKKRRKEQEEEESGIPMSNVEAAELLAQLQQGEPTNVEEIASPRTLRSAAVVVESIQDVHDSQLQPIEPDQGVEESDPSQPVPIIPLDEWEEPIKELPQTRTRRKVSLDEYKKRKPNESAVSAPPRTRNSAQAGGSGFIPHLSEEQLIAEGGLRSIRLANIPDPSEIGRSSETLDDLKARIYGKRYVSEQRTTRSGAVLASEEVPPPPPPPGPPPPKRKEPPYPNEAEDKGYRPSLAERLRTEFGLQDDEGVPSTSYPPQGYPPPPLDPASFNAVYQQQQMKGGEEHDDSDSDVHEEEVEPVTRRSSRWDTASPQRRGRGMYRGKAPAPRYGARF